MEVAAVALREDLDCLCGCYSNGMAYCWSLSGQLKGKWQTGHQGPPSCMRVLNRSKIVTIASGHSEEPSIFPVPAWDGCLVDQRKEWSIQRGAPAPGENQLSPIALSESGIVAIPHRYRVKFWDLRTLKELMCLECPDFGDDFYVAEFSQTGRFLAAAGSVGRVLDVVARTQVGREFLFSEDGSAELLGIDEYDSVLFLKNRRNNSVTLWDYQSGKILHQWDDCPNPPADMFFNSFQIFNRHGTLLMYPSEDVLQIREPLSGCVKMRLQSKDGGYLTCSTWGATGNLVAAGTHDGNLLVWRIEDEEPWRAFRAE